MRNNIPIKGRGSSGNPKNRFTDQNLEYDQDEITGEIPLPKTQFIPDHSKSVISYNKSSDVKFDASINPYRGCEHGCIYCYARPYHEYLGYSSGLDFESKIVVKYDIAPILKKELTSPKWKPQIIAMSGVTDIYQPIERKLQLSRSCLKVLSEFRNPVGLITKNHLITRDIDLLSELNKYNCVSVNISVTTLDKYLCGIMEPRTSRPKRRMEAIKKLSEAGIPVGVNVAPVIPGLTDHEIPEILDECKRAGATYATYIILRLPYNVKDLFIEWLSQHFPDRKQKIIHRLQDLRNGNLNDPHFGSRMKGKGVFAEQISKLFKIHTNRLGYIERPMLSVDHFTNKTKQQLSLF